MIVINCKQNMYIPVKCYGPIYCNLPVSFDVHAGLRSHRKHNTLIYTNYIKVIGNGKIHVERLR